MEGYRYLSESGVIVADTADTRTTVENEWRAQFGQDLVVTSDTSQGTLINAETAARTEVMRNNAQLATVVMNPRVAGGIFLDAICSFLDLYREQPTFSIISGAVLTGQPNTPVPAGVRARSESGALWALVQGVTLDATGTATGQFRCLETGPIQCATGSLNAVVDMVLGWETVTNPNAAVLGQNEQSDASLRQLRINTLGRQGISTPEAIVSALYDPARVGARSVAFRENVADITQTIDNVELVPHSIWVCVDGGTDAAVAMALLDVKTIGAGWNGNVEIEVTEAISGQVYTVKFDRPTQVPVEIEFRVRRGTYVGDPVLDIPPAVISWADGNVDNMPGFVVNAKFISPDQIAAGVVTQLPGLIVVGTRVRNVGGDTWQEDALPIEIWEKGQTATGFISVVVIP